eukprot:scaffold3151_cov110-Cylindrotheca_fusiformis.AAC.4
MLRSKSCPTFATCHHRRGASKVAIRQPSKRVAIPITVEMDNFGLYPLSNILSFLSEEEGCSFLKTKQTWTRQYLPLFRLREPEEMRQKMERDLNQYIDNLLQDGASRPPDRFNNDERSVGAQDAATRSERLISRLRLAVPRGKKDNTTRSEKRSHYKFVVAPVQDAATRLDRLNTRRWRERRLKEKDKTTRQVARQEWRHPSAFPPLLRLWSSTNDEAYFQPGVTVLASYPRSGNTLLRSFLESVTGIVTSSDTRADRPLSQELADRHDLVGEGLYLPPICKTHWPERKGCRIYRARRAIVVVRNPFDAIDSFWNLNLTNTHTEKVTEEIYNKFEGFFEDLVRNEMKVWSDFLRFWATQSDIPVLMVRYEDLVLRPRSQLERIFSFYAKGNDGMTASDLWADRIDVVLANRSSHGYQSSSDSKSHTSIGRSVSTRYKPELLREMHALDRENWLKRLGYHVYEQEFPNNLNSLPVLELPSGDTPFKSLAINTGIDLRPPDSPYGRLMRNWRRKHTKDDTEPFPTIPHNR